MNLYLPDKITIYELTVVTRNPGDVWWDVLIGMDIISAGNFSVKNVNSKTEWTFSDPIATAQRARWIVRPTPKRLNLIGGNRSLTFPFINSNNFSKKMAEIPSRASKSRADPGDTVSQVFFSHPQNRKLNYGWRLIPTMSLWCTSEQ